MGNPNIKLETSARIIFLNRVSGKCQHVFEFTVKYRVYSWNLKRRTLDLGAEQVKRLK